MVTKKVGVIGLGKQFQSEVLPSLLLCEKLLSVEAICDTNQEFLNEVHKEFPKARLYSTYQELLKKEHLDAVVLCLPHFLYYPVCKAALKKHLSVFKEKPFAVTYKEAVLLTQQSDKQHTPIFTITKRSYYPSYLTAKKYLPQLGTVYQYTARHYIPNGVIFQGWRSEAKTAGGGVFLDMGYHLLDVLLTFFGVPEHVAIAASNTGKEGYEYHVEDCATLLLTHKNNLHGSFQLSCLSGPKEESIEIRGTKGTLKVSKNSITIFDNETQQTTQSSFLCDGIHATSLGLRAFLSNDETVLSDNKTQHMNLMKIITQAYKGVSL